jgi:hypothetical protein
VAQQAFSSDQGSTLHLAIPALETLHKAWSSRAEKLKYAHFGPALKAAAAKLDEYYKKTTDSPAYIMAMCELVHVFLLPSNIYNTVLDPTRKMAYFKKNWPAHLHADVLACAEEVVG